MARKMKLPLAISWHTNLHEFGAMRLAKYVGWMGQRAKGAISQICEDLILDAVICFYKLGDVLYAPNEELVEMLQCLTGKPVFLMSAASTPNFSTPRSEPCRTVSFDSGTSAARRPRRMSSFSAISKSGCNPRVYRRSGS
jgi:hypothetical protein